MAEVVDWNLSISEEAGKRGLTPGEVSIFFGDTPWSRVTAYLVQNSKLPSGTGMTSKEISRRVMVDFSEDSSTNVQRSVDRALVKMAKDGHVVYSADRPRRYRLNSRMKSVREIQRAISDLMGSPDARVVVEHVLPESMGSHDTVFGRVALEAKRLRPATWRPMAIPPIQRVVIEALVEAAAEDSGNWVPRALIYHMVHSKRPCSQGRVSQVLGILSDLGIIESRKEGRCMFYRISSRCSGMDADQAYDEYRKARSSARQSR